MINYSMESLQKDVLKLRKSDNLRTSQRQKSSADDDNPLMWDELDETPETIIVENDDW